MRIEIGSFGAAGFGGGGRVPAAAAGGVGVPPLPRDPRPREAARQAPLRPLLVQRHPISKRYDKICPDGGNDM
jgi:hypothetical protein